MKVRSKSDVHDHVYDEFDHQCLEPNKVYEVIGLNDTSYRLVDEAGEPILYPKYLFTVIDSSIPDWWVRSDYGQGEYHIDPPELCGPGFYEDYFDRSREAIGTFRRVMERLQREQE